MADIKIKKIFEAGKLIYPATILDAVKDATAKITVDGQEVDNPSYGKSIREIITDNEKVTAAALNDLNDKIANLESADASAVTAEKIAAWDGAVSDVAVLKGADTVEGSVAKAVKDAKDAVTGTTADAATALTLNGLSKAIAAEEQARKDQVGDLGKVGEGADAADQTVKGYVDAAVAAASTGATAEVNELNETLFGKEAEGTEGEEGYVPAVEGEIPALKARVSANETAIATLTGTGEGSVKKAADDATASAIATLLGETEEEGGSIDDKFDTLKEIADWILASDTNSEALNAAERIGALETAVGAPASGEGVDAVEASGLYKAIADEATTARAAEKANADAIDALQGDTESTVADVEEALNTYIENGFTAVAIKDNSDYADVFEAAN